MPHHRFSLMRSLIAYALIAFAALAVLILLARSRRRKGSRPRKHLRIDLLAAKGQEECGAAVDVRRSSLP